MSALEDEERVHRHSVQLGEPTPTHIVLEVLNVPLALLKAAFHLLPLLRILLEETSRLAHLVDGTLLHLNVQTEAHAVDRLHGVLLDLLHQTLGAFVVGALKEVGTAEVAAVHMLPVGALVWSNEEHRLRKALSGCRVSVEDGNKPLLPDVADVEQEAVRRRSVGHDTEVDNRRLDVLLDSLEQGRCAFDVVPQALQDHRLVAFAEVWIAVAFAFLNNDLVAAYERQKNVISTAAERVHFLGDKTWGDRCNAGDVSSFLVHMKLDAEVVPRPLASQCVDDFAVACADGEAGEVDVRGREAGPQGAGEHSHHEGHDGGGDGSGLAVLGGLLADGVVLLLLLLHACTERGLDLLMLPSVHHGAAACLHHCVRDADAAGGWCQRPG